MADIMLHDQQRGSFHKESLSVSALHAVFFVHGCFIEAACAVPVQECAGAMANVGIENIVAHL